MFWRSQNVSDTALEFTLLKNKPVTFDNTNADVSRYAQYLFNIARGPYVAFGPQNLPQALVFRIVRSKRDIVLSLARSGSYFPLFANGDMLEYLFSKHDIKIGPKLFPFRLRFAQQPAIRNDVAKVISEYGDRLGWTQVAVDGRRKIDTKKLVRDLIGKENPIIHDNFILSFVDVDVLPRAPTILSRNLAYFIAKRKLETFMLNNDIQENPQSDEFSREFREDLFPLYTTWLRSMIALDDDDMPYSLRNVWLSPDTTKEQFAEALENNRSEWASYFMRQDTKYPVLIAGAYLWRIAHWLALW